MGNACPAGLTYVAEPHRRGQSRVGQRTVFADATEPSDSTQLKNLPARSMFPTLNLPGTQSSLGTGNSIVDSIWTAFFPLKAPALALNLGTSCTASSRGS